MALPSLMWAGWALRLMPPGDYDYLRYRAALAIMLATAVTGAEDYRAARPSDSACLGKQQKGNALIPVRLVPRSVGHLRH